MENLPSHKEMFFLVERKFKESGYHQRDIIGATKKWRIAYSR